MTAKISAQFNCLFYNSANGRRCLPSSRNACSVMSLTRPRNSRLDVSCRVTIILIRFAAKKSINDGNITCKAHPEVFCSQKYRKLPSMHYVFGFYDHIWKRVFFQVLEHTFSLESSWIWILYFNTAFSRVGSVGMETE